MLKFCRIEVYDNVPAYERKMRSKILSMKEDMAIKYARNRGKEGKITIITNKLTNEIIYENHCGIEKIIEEMKKE